MECKVVQAVDEMRARRRRTARPLPPYTITATGRPVAFLCADFCGISLVNVDGKKGGSAVKDNCFNNLDAKANNTSPQQLQLIRQCSAAAMNFAASEAAGGSCDNELVPTSMGDKPISEIFNACCDASSLCTSGAKGSKISESKSLYEN